MHPLKHGGYAYDVVKVSAFFPDWSLEWGNLVLILYWIWLRWTVEAQFFSCMLLLCFLVGTEASYYFTLHCNHYLLKLIWSCIETVLPSCFSFFLVTYTLLSSQKKIETDLFPLTGIPFSLYICFCYWYFPVHSWWVCTIVPW